MDEKPKNSHGGTKRDYELAGLVERVVASVIDSFLLILPLAIIAAILSQSGALPEPLTQFLGLAVPIAYHWYFWTRRNGQTPGKFALGIRVIKADGSVISDTDAVIRAIGYQVSGMLLGIGFLWAIIDKRNQGWHDKLARTYVVRNDSQRKTVEVAS